MLHGTTCTHGWTLLHTALIWATVLPEESKAMQRLRGMYHHLRAEDVAIFRGVLLDKWAIWGQEVMNAGTSCGSAVEVGRETGNGLYVQEVPIGPFRG